MSDARTPETVSHLGDAGHMGEDAHSGVSSMSKTCKDSVGNVEREKQVPAAV